MQFTIKSQDAKVDARLYVSADHITYIHIHCLLVSIATAEGGL